MSNVWRWSHVTFIAFTFYCSRAGLSPLLARILSRQSVPSGYLRWGADAEGGAPYVYPDRSGRSN
jgi:hypothetical protein